MIPLRDNIVSRTTPVVNYGIILACIGIFVWQAVSPREASQYAFKPEFLFSLHELVRLGLGNILTRLMMSTFMHGSVLHIAFNMLFLYVFGDNVEDRMGHLRYIVFYLLCGFLATLSHSFMSIIGLGLGDSAGLNTPIVGASGAIAGILGAYFYLFRGASVRTLILIVIVPLFIDLPASIFLIIWFVMQVFQGLSTLGTAGSSVAFWAHIGGFVAGYYLVRSFVPRGRRYPPRPRILRIDTN